MLIELVHFTQIFFLALVGGVSFCLLFAATVYCLGCFLEMNDRWKRMRRNLDLQRLILKEELYQTRQRSNRRRRR